ncbi:MAG: hypothetical protein K6B51_06375 [Bacilli bacterium]|nr:hypothetical protein [Bacilli bacterium]
MGAPLRLTVAALGLVLSSCVGKVSSSVASSAPEVNSSEQVPSSTLSSSAKPSVQASSSTEKSSSEKPSPSSSTAVHYTVSIYQSYYIEEKGEYGNPRFDTSVMREEGQFLFKDTKEEHDLRRICRPDYRGLGQIYFMFAFYKNEKCRERIIDGFAVDADLSIYYYCE